jgi:hypothetical protein
LASLPVLCFFVFFAATSFATSLSAYRSPFPENCVVEKLSVVLRQAPMTSVHAILEDQPSFACVVPKITSVQEWFKESSGCDIALEGAASQDGYVSRL